MRIIKAGVLPETQVKHLECNHCGCRFECTKGEMKTQQDRNDLVHYIDCPTCNRPVWSN